MKRLGAAWAPAAIREMLLNPIYRGEYVWNRSEWIKDRTEAPIRAARERVGT
jgi:hypothetical protein